MGLRGLVSGGISGSLTALGLVLAANPAFAQQTAPATNQATPAPTPTPTPGTIGNPALKDFSLDGTVTREATPPPAAATPTPAPAPSDPSPTNTAPSPARDAPSAPTRAPSREVDAAPASSLDSAPSSALPSVEPSLPAASSVTTASDLLPPPAVPADGPSPWPWLAAFAVALAAAGAWWWSRRRHGEDTLAFAGHSPAADAAPLSRAMPAPKPAPKPVSDIATAPRTPTPVDGGIVSRTLLPKLAFELVPLKFETDDKNNARLTFELVVVNLGSAPARDIRVEAKMFNAGPQQDMQIVQFFRAPSAMGAKLPAIAPQDRVPLRSRIGMLSADYQALDIGGRSLVVPMIAVNAVYRGAAGEAQDSASWLVGALPSGGDAEKLRPFPLGKAVAATALAARRHSAGVQA